MWYLSYWLDWWKHSLCWSVFPPIQQMEDAFIAAVQRGDLPEVEELLAKGCPANAKYKVEYTHLV